MAIEIELKLAIPEAYLQATRQHPLIVSAASQGPAKTLYNTYFDTPQLALRAAKIALRTRVIDGKILQTVKCASRSVGGLSSRPEWEQPMNGDTFDFSAVEDLGARQLLQDNLAFIQPVFETTFERETRIARPREGIKIAIMIDTGRVHCAHGESAICELELELIAGTADDLIMFANALRADLPLTPDDISKAQRGFALVTSTV